MRDNLSCDSSAGPARHPRRAGITLVEVLTAILVTGIGLLALLTLFPLGALEMAQAIKDDRTAAVAVNAVALSQAGQELLARTREFVFDSLSDGSADPKTAGRLREEYEDLAAQAADIETQLRELQLVFPHPQAQGYLARLLGQIRFIKHRLATLAALLSLLEDWRK